MLRSTLAPGRALVSRAGSASRFSAQLLEPDYLEESIPRRPCRLIRIHNNVKSRPLKIAQVQAWASDGTNRAFAGSGGVASQTSTWQGGFASRAIDGNPGKPVTHTAPGRNEYWQVSLNPPSLIDTVDVFAAATGDLSGATIQMIDWNDDLFFQETLTGCPVQSILFEARSPAPGPC